MKRILVILGHPNKNSLNKAIADSYIKGAKTNKNFEIKKLYLYELRFDPILHYGYQKIQKLEPDLKKSQALIKWANHIVFIFPIWWGHMPALLKGFIDRTFLPGFAFKFKKTEKKREHEKYLKGKTASLIITTGGPKIMYFLFGNLILLSFKKAVLGFCGIKSKKTIFFCAVRKISKERADKILDKARILGEKGI